MKLTKIQIENFRSIKSQTIIIDHNCLILLGKNEAGKSNILKAIAAVFGQYKVSNKDKRKKIANETIEYYYVRAIIELSETDCNEIMGLFIEKYTNAESIIFNDKKTLRDFVKTVFHEIVIQIDLGENKSERIAYWVFPEANFELVNEVFLDGTTFNTEKQGKKQVAKEFAELVFELIKELYAENPYVCHYWQYANSLLLPSSISISKFISSPEECKPLNNIFVLCNRQDIKKEFSDAKSQDGDYENLLDQVSKEITKIFLLIWKDFRGTSIELIANGEEMVIKVVNKTKYSFEDRSDGFKKFISILLILSTQARSKKIGERDLILIDEPDQSLYPTSAEYLRNELIKISETARIIYTTHSTYMIDSDNPGRHLIVEKEDDITTINKQDENAPFSKDELFRRAVGSSIFEVINTKNIIFEGWLDKELFTKYNDFHKKTKGFYHVGTVYLGGISGVETLVQMLILANKKFIIVADSDAVSKSKQKEFENNYEEYASSWLSYGDVVNDILTMEDFISIELMTKTIKIEYPDFVYDSSKKAIENIDHVVKGDKEKKQKIKKEIIKNLRKTDICDNYSVFIEKLSLKVEKL